MAERAVAGVDAVYHIGPTLHPREREMGLLLVDAARAAGVGHFVFSSVLHAIITDLVQHEIKRDVEEHLLASDLEFTILQPSNYMLPLKLRPAFERGVFELSWSLERLQSLVDLDDVTDVAVRVLTDRDRHLGATYELAAPGRYTAHALGCDHSAGAGTSDHRGADRRGHLPHEMAAGPRPGTVPARASGDARHHRPVQRPRLRREPERPDLAARPRTDRFRAVRQA